MGPRRATGGKMSLYYVSIVALALPDTCTGWLMIFFFHSLGQGAADEVCSFYIVLLSCQARFYPSLDMCLQDENLGAKAFLTSPCGSMHKVGLQSPRGWARKIQTCSHFFLSV